MNGPADRLTTGVVDPFETNLSLVIQQDQNLDEFGDGEAAGLHEPGGWSQVGGLSLPIDIPTDGYQRSFSKVGGQPQLALRVRSRELLDTGVGLIWTLVWLGIGVGVVITLSRCTTVRDLTMPLVWVLFAAGLASFIAMPGVLSGLGFVCFAVAWLVIVGRFVRNRATA